MHLTFEQWMNRVDDAVSERLGLSVHDLPDADFRAMYDDDIKPERAAARAIRNAQE